MGYGEWEAKKLVFLSDEFLYVYARFVRILLSSRGVSMRYGRRSWTSEYQSDPSLRLEFARGRYMQYRQRRNNLFFETFDKSILILIKVSYQIVTFALNLPHSNRILPLTIKIILRYFRNRPLQPRHLRPLLALVPIIVALRNGRNMPLQFRFLQIRGFFA